MNVFLFPGQGSQEVGMGADLFADDTRFSHWIAEASAWTGTDLRQLCLKGPERDLTRTECLQPLLVAVSLGYWARLLDRGIRPDLVLGHSLGEISALAAAGIVTPEEAIKIGCVRGRCMGMAAAKLEGGLLAVLSPQREAVLAKLGELLGSGRVFVANDNAPGQFLLAGEAQPLADAARLVTSSRLGACRHLPVGGPWHSPLMAEAQAQFVDWLKSISFRPPQVKILMNVSAQVETDPEHIRSLVAQNLTEPVRWSESLEQARRLDPRTMYEIGPGRVLAGLARANGVGAEVAILGVNSTRSLDRLASSP